MELNLTQIASIATAFNTLSLMGESSIF